VSLCAPYPPNLRLNALPVDHAPAAALLDEPLPPTRDMFRRVPRVLVTGAARGIGRATTLRLAAAGWDVIAAVRQEADGDELLKTNPGPSTTVALDITDPDQVAALEERLPGELDALVNNAGVVVGGPIEAIPPAELRRQLEVNVVGQAAVTQALLPRLRASRGRIVFVSSLSGRVATPLTGAYNASKFALEGMADAMRMELAPWGIKVMLVEPAQTDTDMWRLADADLDGSVAALSPAHRELYAKHIAGFRKTIPRSQRMAKPVDTVAATIEKALTASRPKARYVVGTGPRVQALMAKLTPTPLLDRMLRAGTGVPRKP
jgi:NAD(P)-dependent dehydrogenase (short-subunit alcohol dehydrogenase family)